MFYPNCRKHLRPELRRVRSFDVVLAIWFLMPWLCFFASAGSLALCLVTRDWTNPRPVAVGLGGIALGQVLVLLQGYNHYSH